MGEFISTNSDAHPLLNSLLSTRNTTIHPSLRPVIIQIEACRIDAVQAWARRFAVCKDGKALYLFKLKVLV
jgi:hypothetical protein